MLTRLLRIYLRPYRVKVALVTLLLFGQAIGGLYLPTLNAEIINKGVIEGDLHAIWTIGGIMLVVTLLLGVVSIVSVYWSSQVAMGAGADVRGDVFRQVQQFSAREMNHIGTPSLITRNTNDVQQVQIFMQVGLTMLVVAPIMCVGGIILSIKASPQLSLLLLVALPVMLTLIGITLIAVVPKFRTLQVRLDRLNQILREQITGVRVIRAFVRNDVERERFEGANDSLTATSLYVNRVFALTFPMIFVVMNLSSVAIIWFGGHLVDSGSMPIGNLTAFLSYIMMILFSVMMAVMAATLLPRAVASSERILEVLDTAPSVAEPAPVRVARPSRVDGIVTFERVGFGYPGSELPVLEDLDFTLRPGETSAIIGGTGSGKTTLLNLIPRFFDATEGTVRVNGVDVRSQELEALWSTMAIVPQSSYLFTGTVAENLRLGAPDATDADLWRALEIAQGRDFVASMPEGLESRIDQGGTNVSGGQRQRLSIARAVVKQPQLYLFDDCFSALDAATDARLREALKAATRWSTVVMVSQRVSTVMGADVIIVLDDGRIVGMGSHRELMASCLAYGEIVASQAGQEAAA